MSTFNTAAATTTATTTLQLSKRQRIEHEDLEMYCDHILALQRKIALPMLNRTDGSFVNVWRPTERLADVTLRLQFDNLGPFPMSTDVQTHRIVLASHSAYFDGLFNDAHCGTTASIVPIRITLHYDEAPVVKEFFRLFYVSVFDDAMFTTQQLEFIVTNVLILHHLASQFLFDALRKYCRHKLYERFDIPLFGVIFNQCVARQVDQRLYVIPGNESLFRRLIAWFVCCADVHNSRLPFVELGLRDDDDADANGDMTMDVSIINPLTSRPNPLITPPPQQRTHGGKRKRLSASNEKKVQVLDYMRSIVDSFDLYDTYSFCLRHDETTNTTSIRSFGRLCETCANNKQTLHIARINQTIDNGETRRRWHVYLDLSSSSPQASSSLYVNIKTRHGKAIITPMRCQSRVTVLSNRYQNKTQAAQQPVFSTLDSFTLLQHFYLDDIDCCYTGECDACHESNVRLFIVKYEIEATGPII